MNTDNRVQELAGRLFAELSRRFPVSSSSDEFHYFPQVPAEAGRMGEWDDYSPGSIAAMCAMLREFEAEIEAAAPHADPDETIDLELLARVCRTLRGEWERAGPWRTQPTYYLSIASIGLAQTLELSNPEPARRRLSGLPGFLGQALSNLADPPGLFLALGREMVRDTREWLAAVPGLGDAGPALAALERFDRGLSRLSGPDDYTLPGPVLDRVVNMHIGVGTDAAGALAELETEIEQMEAAMTEAAGELSPGRSWREVLAALPYPTAADNDLLSLYRDEITRLERHCLEQGLVSEELVRRAPVRVEAVPDYLVSLRGTGAYAAIPAHPAAGGTFYLAVARVPAQVRDTLSRDCRMLAAHETYPGHHLLDACRWDQRNLVRRHLEFPLYYEGWACFAEELLLETGYLSGPADRLLLARRHHWRAVRGKIDLSLQLKTMDLGQAASLFASAGMDRGHAARAVRTYPLKPGYQICYTLGRRRFRTLFERFGRERPADFARAALREGEIGIERLAQIMCGRRGQRK